MPNLVRPKKKQTINVQYAKHSLIINLNYKDVLEFVHTLKSVQHVRKNLGVSLVWKDMRSNVLMINFAEYLYTIFLMLQSVIVLKIQNSYQFTTKAVSTDMVKRQI